ncbi:HdeD family acid-resistance protein [Gryllotalpicola reticulitermitis]|uniref:HdeD family acid-resistance protein n=1 Tax=Gryllotalpicola reticulitermitis TaxID=1184153 RepID=A0ABV8Q6F1_9MICO
MAARYWLAQLVRAVIAFAAGFVITLNQDHTAAFGIAMFALFAIVSGLAVGAFWFVTDAGKRSLWIVQGALGVAAGIVTLIVHTGALGALLYGVSVWALLTGVTELFGGWRARRGVVEASVVVAARDRMLVGAATVVLAILYLIIPADNRLAVGLFGAYAIVIGVYLAIGAFSLKWANPTQQASAAENTESHA